MAGEPRFGMDMESNGFFHFKERVSLIQLAVGREVVIVDPLAIADFSALGPLLANPKQRKILHGCDYDLRSFDREYGFHFGGLYDTAIATQLLNVELMGLGRALETYLGVKVEKLVRLQRSDWSKRPIPADALEYAAGDAAHLFNLCDTLDAKLAELGRTAWMTEECAVMERIRYEAPPPPEEAYANVKGTFDLTPRELAIFRELYLLREGAAAQLDRPQFKVITNDALLTIAREPGRHFETIPNANVRWLKSVEPEIDNAIRRGMDVEPIMHPSRGKRSRSPWTDESRTRWQSLHAVRAAAAAALGIGPSTLWPTRSLEQIAIHPDLLEQELRGATQFGVRNWQRTQFGETLERAVRQPPAAPPALSGEAPG